MKTGLLVIIISALCSVAFAQGSGSSRRHQDSLPSVSGPADCVFTFQSGVNDTFQKYCITANGNVTVFESPVGEEHLAVGVDGEGYGLCDIDHNIAYNDYAEFGNSGNWGSTTVVSRSTTAVTLARTTTDGHWTLTQTFTQLKGASPSLKIAMTLRNNTSTDIFMSLLRYANVDAGNTLLNNFDSTANGAFGWNSSSDQNPSGLVLQNVGEPKLLFGGFAQSGPDGPAPCSPGAHLLAAPQSGIDGSVLMIYSGTLFAGTSQTVTVSYRGF